MELNLEWDPEPLDSIVKGIEYMPGWMIYLGTDNENGEAPVLHIISSTPNSYEHDKPMRVNHSFLVPLATYNERTWKAWIRECYEKVWRHEIGEFLMFDGVREFAPHHGNGENPYIVWHIGDLDDTRVKAGHDKDEIDFNTVVTYTDDAVISHTYSPKCPQGCYGQMDECIYKQE